MDYPHERFLKVLALMNVEFGRIHAIQSKFGFYGPTPDEIKVLVKSVWDAQPPKVRDLYAASPDKNRIKILRKLTAGSDLGPLIDMIWEDFEKTSLDDKQASMDAKYMMEVPDIRLLVRAMISRGFSPEDQVDALAEKHGYSTTPEALEKFRLWFWDMPALSPDARMSYLERLPPEDAESSVLVHAAHTPSNVVKWQLGLNHSVPHNKLLEDIAASAYNKFQETLRTPGQAKEAALWARLAISASKDLHTVQMDAGNSTRSIKDELQIALEAVPDKVRPLSQLIGPDDTITLASGPDLKESAANDAPPPLPTEDGRTYTLPFLPDSPA